MPKIRKNCQECGADFLTYPSRVRNGKGKYCSRICSDKNKTGAPKGCMISKECKECGNLYKVHPYRKDSKFCSKKCHYEYNRDERQCLNCDNIFKIKRSRPDIYCSPLCYQEHNTIINSVNRDCCECGIGFYVPKNSISKGRGVYCSKNCRDKSFLKYPKTRDLRAKVRNKRKINNLSGAYISNLYGMPMNNIPQELIELKRLNIKRKRKLKEITHGNSQ